MINMNTAKNALIVYTKFISKKLGVTLGEPSIVRFVQSTGNKPGPKEPESDIWVYVGSAIGALILLAVCATVYFMRKR